MERIDNKDIDKAKKRKFMTESKRAGAKIGKGDDKIDTSKMTMRPDAGKKGLADAYRFKMGLPAGMSDADVLKMYKQKGVTNQKAQQDINKLRAQKDKDFSNPRLSDQDIKKLDEKYNSLNNLSGKKAGGSKIPKKPIMALPTNVPRLMRGAVLGDLDKDGKMSGYETARQKAITKNMNEQKPKKAMSGLAVGINKIKNK